MEVVDGTSVGWRVWRLAEGMRLLELWRAVEVSRTADWVSCERDGEGVGLIE